MLLAPWWLLQFALLGAGLGLAFSALTVKYRDVTYVLPWLIQIGLYASPVAYALSAVPENVRFFFMVNPVTWLLEGFRFSLLDTPSPPLWQWIAAPSRLPHGRGGRDGRLPALRAHVRRPDLTRRAQLRWGKTPRTLPCSTAPMCRFASQASSTGAATAAS